MAGDVLEGDEGHGPEQILVTLLPGPEHPALKGSIVARWRKPGGEFGIEMVTSLERREWKLIDHLEEMPAPAKVTVYAEFALPMSMADVTSGLGKVARKHPKAQVASIYHDGKVWMAVFEPSLLEAAGAEL